MRLSACAGNVSARLALGLAVAACALAPVGAGRAEAEVQAIGRYKDWRVYTEKVGKDLICFAAVDASDKAPKAVDHGDVTFYIATWKSGSAVNQPSLRVGYDLRTDIPPEARIGRSRFRMFAAGPEAFVEDSRERSLVDAIKKGSELKVEAAGKDARTAYHFSLSGSSDAIDKARALCR
ncbi:MAG: hypothetical protein R3C52_14430 [Hyphomonadaceae bacterium]